MEIPYKRLSPEILRGVIEQFVLREGTDYGHDEYSLEEKVRAVERQLERGVVQIVFDHETETCNIVKT